MKKAFLFILFIQMMFMPLAHKAFPQCGTVDNNLSLVLPCVEYEGQYYKLSFSAYKNPADPAWLYWRYESIQPATGGSSCANCAHADTALTITAPCVYYAGKNIAITLEYYINPAEPNGLYWKLGSQFTLNQVDITSISGDTTELLYQYYSSPEFQAAILAYMDCAAQCDEDVTCLMACMPDFGLGSTFSLAIELYNPGTPIQFVLPAGAFFQASADVQPMLIAIDTCLTVPQGYKKFLVPTYCMAGDAHAPSDEDMFAIAGAGIAQQACIAEILDLIRGKEDLSQGESYIIQDAVWTCMENGSITEAQRTDLQNL